MILLILSESNCFCMNIMAFTSLRVFCPSFGAKDEVLYTCQFRQINSSWPDHHTEKNVSQIGDQQARLLCSIIDVCHGQGLVFSHMLFLASKNDNTLVCESGMLVEEKSSLRTENKGETAEREWAVSLFSCLSSLVDFWIYIFFNSAGNSFTEYKLSTSQDTKNNKRMNCICQGLDRKAESIPIHSNFRQEEILSRVPPQLNQILKGSPTQIVLQCLCATPKPWLECIEKDSDQRMPARF